MPTPLNIDARAWRKQRGGGVDSVFRDRLRPHFWDDFKAGAYTKTLSSIVYGGATETLATNSVATSPSGSLAAKFAFQSTGTATPSICGRQMILPSAWPEFYVKFDVYVPANYAHRFVRNFLVSDPSGFQVGDVVTLTGVGGSVSGTVRAVNGYTVTFNPTSMNDPSGLGDVYNARTLATVGFSDQYSQAANNQLIRAWSGDDGMAAASRYYGIELYPITSGGSYVQFSASWQKNESVETFEYLHNVALNWNLGAWNSVAIAFNASRQPGVAGKMCLWINGALHRSELINNYSDAGFIGVDQIELFGQSASGYDNALDFWIDNIEVDKENIWSLP